MFTSSLASNNIKCCLIRLILTCASVSSLSFNLFVSSRIELCFRKST